MEIVPEEGSARRILQRIARERLIERVFEAHRDAEEWMIAWNTGLIDMAGYIASKMIDPHSFDAVVAYTEESATLGYSIARWMRRKLLIASRSPAYRASSYTCTYTLENSTPILICLPRKSLKRGTRALLATIRPRPGATEVAAQLLNGIGVKIIDTITIYLDTRGDYAVRTISSFMNKNDMLL